MNQGGCGASRLRAGARRVFFFTLIFRSQLAAKPEPVEYEICKCAWQILLRQVGNASRTQARRAVRPLANVAMGRGLVTHEGHDNLDKCFFCWQPKKQLHPRFSAQTIIFSITYSTGIA